MGKIKGGYYILAKQMEDGWIGSQPPHFREIWKWLIKNACYEKTQCGGIWLERGQLLTSYKEIQDGLSWKIGCRKMHYITHLVETALKALRKASMVTTSKASHKIIVTICKFDFYQDINNYENRIGNLNGNLSENLSGDLTPINLRKKKEKRINIYPPNRKNCDSEETQNECGAMEEGLRESDGVQEDYHIAAIKSCSAAGEEFAMWFETLCSENTKKIYCKNGHIAKWGEVYDKLLKQGRTHQEIYDVCKWGRTHERFWKANFQTPSKLIVKSNNTKEYYFDIMLNQMNGEGKNGRYKDFDSEAVGNLFK